MKPIHHIWFDLSETIAVYSPAFTAARDNLLHEVYGEAVKKPVDENLKQEVLELRKKHGSNAKIFHVLGLGADYWHKYFATLNEEEFFKPEPRIFKTLDQLRTCVPISLFTNTRHPEKILKQLGVDPAWFSHVLTSKEVPVPKPELDGFQMMIEKSAIPAGEIMYVGDDVKKDILPAKSLGMQTAMMWGNSEEADYSFEKFEDILRLFSH